MADIKRQSNRKIKSSRQRLEKLRPAAATRKNFNVTVTAGGITTKTDVILQSVSDHVCMVDKDFNVTWVNETFYKIYGGDIIGKKCYEVFHARKDPCEIRICPVIQTFQDGKEHQCDVQVTNKNGKTINFHCVTNVVSRDDRGKPAVVMEIFRDVTKFKKLEAALLQSNRRYRSILEQAPVGIGLATLDGKIIYANKVLVNILGYTSEELKKIGLTDLYENTEDRCKLLEMLNRDSRVSNFMTRFKRKDGTLYDVFLNTSKVKIGDRDLLQTICVDVTEQKKAEESVIIANERLKYLLSSTSAIIYSCQPSGDYRANFVSENVVNMTGYEPQEFIENPKFWIEHIHPDDVQRILREAQGILREELHTYEYRFLHKNGSYIWVRDEMKLVRDEKGNPLEIVGYWIDITDRKQAEKRLLDYQKQLRFLSSELFLAGEHERKRLAAGIHNNISQKLALAKIKLQSLKISKPDKNISEPLAEVGEVIEQTMQELHSLMFEMSNPVLYELGLDAAIRQWMTEQIQSKHKIECKFTVDVKPLKLDNKISIILFEAVRELLVNVIKYAKAKTVQIHIRKKENKIHIDVEDDGVGFVPSKLDSILLQGRKGGFGLFCIKERLEYLGGNMNIKSSPGKGTCVTLAAPLSDK